MGSTPIRPTSSSYVLRAIQLSVSCRKSVLLHCTNAVTICVSRLAVQFVPIELLQWIAV